MFRTLPVLLLVLFINSSCTGDQIEYGEPIPVTVMCWNVEQFLAPSAYSRIAGEIAAQQADILILSEARSSAGGDALKLANALSSAGWPMQYHAFADYWNGLAVFSRHPIKSTDEVAYGSGPRDIYRVDITLPNNRIITLYGAHLDSGAAERDYFRRLNQALALSIYIRSNHDLSRDNVIILGDMNTMGSNQLEPNEDFLPGNTLDRLCLKNDAIPENDFFPVNHSYLPDTDTHSWPSLLDHIILSPRAMSNYVPGSVVVPETPWFGSGIYSDHRPVKVILDI